MCDGERHRVNISATTEANHFVNSVWPVTGGHLCLSAEPAEFELGDGWRLMGSSNVDKLRTGISFYISRKQRSSMFWVGGALFVYQSNHLFFISSKHHMLVYSATISTLCIHSSYLFRNWLAVSHILLWEGNNWSDSCWRENGVIIINISWRNFIGISWCEFYMFQIG